MKQLRILFSVFPVSKQKIHLWLFYVLIAILALPIRLVEKIVFGKRVSRQPIDPAPVFIIGHWRSGTTFLHQLMITDKRFGYVNFYQALFPGTFLLTEKIFKPVL